VKEVPLTRGYVALVDDEDYPIAAAHKWYARDGGGQAVYARTNVRLPDGRTTTVDLHRLIVQAAPGTEWDHVNGIGTDCRRSNLRPCTHQQNHGNRPAQAGTSRYRGVSFRRRRGLWGASIGFDGRSRWLGYFRSEEEAARAYDAAARHYFGAFARLNFPEGQPALAS
jgi:hypothetical protein